MKTLNNKGIALITALMLTLITLVIILSVMLLISNNIKSSAANKSYKNVTEAAYGGADLVMQDIIPRLFMGYTTAGASTTVNGILSPSLSSEYNTKSLFLTNKMNMGFGSSACIRAKLLNSAASGLWPAGCSNTLDPKVKPDMQFNLFGTSGQSFTVYSKIIDTVPGVPYPSTAGSEPLTGGGVTESSAPTTTNLNHYVYRIEVAGERTTNATEKSKLSVLYEY